MPLSCLTEPLCLPTLVTHLASGHPGESLPRSESPQPVPLKSTWQTHQALHRVLGKRGEREVTKAYRTRAEAEETQLRRLQTPEGF